MCEFIDNSISNFEKFDLSTRNILITVDIVENPSKEDSLKKKGTRLKKSEKASHYLRIRIEDTGIGMKE